MTTRDPARLHPLAEALGDEWRWLLDEPRRTVVILHRTGLYFEIARDFLEPGRIGEDEARAIAGALRMGVLDRKRGEVGIEVLRGPTLTDARLTSPKRLRLGASR